ncbi:MAG: hypothetical protein FD177_190 [Desulfovibrionaceae bacterium]|nr:MAG: hypothetical protein FD177_190 [Desulfovibrionaceae bacterium]
MWGEIFRILNSCMGASARDAGVNNLTEDPRMPYPTDTGLSDEQARKRQQYEEALGRFAGFEPSESQLTDDQIMARRAARGQESASGAFHHQSPLPPFRQPISGASAMPFETILAQLKARPGMIEHLEGIDLDGDGIPDIPFGSSPPQMMADPMARMQWQAMMQNRQQAKQMRRAQRKAVNNEALLAHLRANDPLFVHVKRWIEAFVETLPGKLQRAVLEQVELTPGAFLEMYSELRQHILEEFGLTGKAQKAATWGATPQATPRDPREAVRQAVAGRMSPPQLESAGMIDERTPGVARAAERAALVKRVKAGGAREGDLLKYLELSGL